MIYTYLYFIYHARYGSFDYLKRPDDRQNVK